MQLATGTRPEQRNHRCDIAVTAKIIPAICILKIRKPCPQGNFAFLYALAVVSNLHHCSETIRHFTQKRPINYARELRISPYQCKRHASACGSITPGGVPKVDLTKPKVTLLVLQKLYLKNSCETNISHELAQLRLKLRIFEIAHRHVRAIAHRKIIIICGRNGNQHVAPLGRGNTFHA